MAFFQIQITTVFNIKGEKKGKGERGKEKLVNLPIPCFQCFPTISVPSCALRAAPQSVSCRERRPLLPRARESGSRDEC